MSLFSELVAGVGGSRDVVGDHVISPAIMLLVSQIALHQQIRIDPINIREIDIPGAFANIAVGMLDPEVRQAECGKQIRCKRPSVSRRP